MEGAIVEVVVVVVVVVDVVVVSHVVSVGMVVSTGILVVVVAVNCHNERLLIERCPGWQQVSVEY